MKTYILRTSAIVCATLLILMALSTSSCKKDETCHGEVTVYDSTGLPLPNASVKLFHQGDTTASYTSKPGNIVYESKTDASGYVKFDIKLPAVFTVRVDHPKVPNKYKLGILILNEPGSKDSQVIRF